MSEVKISELEETTTVQEGCCFPIVTEGVTKKITYGTLAEKLNTIIEPEWTKIKNKPSIYAPSAHTHAQSDITGLETALGNKQGKLTAGTGIKIENDVISATGGSGGGTVDSVNGKTGAVNLSASDVGALPATTTIPTKTSDLQNDSGYITGYTETDPTVPSWAKEATKPSYTPTEVGAMPVSAVVTAFWQGTQAEYEALTTIDATTLYLVKEV